MLYSVKPQNPRSTRLAKEKDHQDSRNVAGLRDVEKVPRNHLSLYYCCVALGLSSVPSLYTIDSIVRAGIASMILELFELRL